MPNQIKVTTQAELALLRRAEAAEKALRGVMNLGYIDGGWWKVATPINVDALTEARAVLKGQAATECDAVFAGGAKCERGAGHAGLHGFRDEKKGKDAK